jgi:inositol-polyphosphate multikinase
MDNDVESYSEGVKCNSDGSLIIKPCTRQEVDFYESSVDHPEIRAFMPTYMGTLTLGSPPQVSPIDPNEITLPPSTINTTLTPKPEPTSLITTQNLPSATSSTAPNTLSPTLSQTPELTGLTSFSPSSPYISAHVTPWIPNPNPLAKHGRPIDTDLSIVLENVANGFVHPNILDVKLGSRLWAEDASAAKRVKLNEDSRNSTSGSLGFRIAGMKVWKGSKVAGESDSAQGDCEDKDGYRCYNKFYGRKLTAANVKKGFEEFLSGLTNVDSQKLLAARFAHEMRCIQLALEREESRMYSASALIVYEGDEEAFENALAEERQREREQKDDPKTEEMDGEVELSEDVDMDEEEGDDEEPYPKVNDIRLIDFAHAQWTPGLGPDENMLQGVRSVVGILEDLANA